MPSLKFTVDAELLRELGQRLVGKPHVALAELVKNGYDADATRIVIRFALEQDHIDVRDNGHGMTLSEFRDFWMRVGTTHKVGNTSRRFHRNMTGSKGVGRLSAQFLGDKLRIISVPEEGPWLSAEVDWTQAASAGDLTEAEVVYEMHENEKPFAQGTQITIGGLRDEWSDPRAIQDLAAEVWWLQPPFRAPIRSPENGDPGCKIEFRSTQEEFRAAFDQQMSAIMDIWTARIVGRNENGTVHMSLEFAGEPPNKFEYRIAELPHNRTGEASSPTYDPETNLNDGEFEIRIYKLQYRQPHGIKVDDAREYFWRYGGVHVYDGGFRLPYYGDKLNDWLGIEQDHSHRRFLSELLPESIQQSYQDTARLRFLPTLARIFGVVRVDTSREPNLEIMITRDRLADTRALQDLTKMVRWAIDMYAYEEARRQYEEKRRRAESLPLPEAMDRMRLFLDEVKVSLPGEARQRADEVASGDGSLVCPQRMDNDAGSALGAAGHRWHVRSGSAARAGQATAVHRQFRGSAGRLGKRGERAFRAPNGTWRKATCVGRSRSRNERRVQLSARCGERRESSALLRSRCPRGGRWPDQGLCPGHIHRPNRSFPRRTASESVSDRMGGDTPERSHQRVQCTPRSGRAQGERTYRAWFGPDTFADSGYRLGCRPGRFRAALRAVRTRKRDLG